MLCFLSTLIFLNLGYTYHIIQLIIVSIIIGLLSNFSKNKKVFYTIFIHTIILTIGKLIECN